MRGATPFLFLFLLLMPALAGCMDEVPDNVIDEDDPFALMDGFHDPLLVTHAGDGSGRLFVVEKKGTVIAVSPNGTRTVFADLEHRVSDGAEQGLLGLAFHPDFASNGVVIASYTDAVGDSVIERFHVDDAGLVDVNTGEVLLSFRQPYSNHNGGHILYGPDGYLYAGFGDGGSFGDPKNHGQRPMTRLGTILRMDVGATGDYSIPADNPYADGKWGAPEVWLWGLRNPWRFAFDDAGNLWIGDVGQGSYEEINRVAPDQAGRSLGWNLWEGNHAYPSGARYDPDEDYEDDVEHIFPVAEYSQDDGHCSVTGGEPFGDVYVFADFCTGTIWTMPLDGEFGSAEVLRDTPYTISSFGRDEAGNVYIVSLSGTVERFSL